MSQSVENNALPFACCPHCECEPGDRVGHDDTCRICQNADGTPCAERHPCGHDKPTTGCGGCDPGAVEYVRDDGGPWRRVCGADG